MTVWWAEGTKQRIDKRRANGLTYPIIVTNTDPRLIVAFMRFMEDLGIPRVRFKVQLHVHEGDDKAELENYWSVALSIPLENFTKTIVRPQGRKIGKTRGTCRVAFSSKEVYYTLRGMLCDLIGE